MTEDLSSSENDRAQRNPHFRGFAEVAAGFCWLVRASTRAGGPPNLKEEEPAITARVSWGEALRYNPSKGSNYHSLMGQPWLCVVTPHRADTLLYLLSWSPRLQRAKQQLDCKLAKIRQVFSDMLTIIRGAPHTLLHSSTYPHFFICAARRLKYDFFSESSHVYMTFL